NIILPGDQIAARTVRRVRRDSEGSRPDRGERRRMFIRLEVEEVSLHKYSNRLRAKGRILEGPEEFVSLGTYHTINVEPGLKIEIIKTHWPQSILNRLKEAAKQKGKRVVVIAVEEGCATIGIVDDMGVDIHLTLQGNTMGKYGKYHNSPEIMGQLFADVALQLRELINQIPDIIKIIVVGPGFTKDKLGEFLQEKIPEIKGRLLLDHVSNGTSAGVYEALQRGIIERVASEIRLSREIKLMDELLRHLGKETGKAAYGWDEIARAVQFGAIETLLVLDKTLREALPEKRKILENLMHQVEKQAGSIEIFSADHQAGKQLAGFGGLAGILRFPLPDS
ncbi:MAG: mRNA surveillance protein pelota, partial [Promethearchaeota archaeon]